MSGLHDPNAQDVTGPSEGADPAAGNTRAEAAEGVGASGAEPGDASAAAESTSDGGAGAGTVTGEPELEVEFDAELGTAEPDQVAVQLAERVEDLQRVTAEFANYRRRTDRDRQVAAEVAKAGVVTRLLPLADDLDLAEQHGDLTEGPLRAFADKFRDILAGLDVQAFGEIGDAFDPSAHEAVQDSSTGDNKVLGTVLRRGYRLGERQLRTAMVIIADPAGDDRN